MFYSGRRGNVVQGEYPPSLMLSTFSAVSEWSERILWQGSSHADVHNHHATVKKEVPHAAAKLDPSPASYFGSDQNDTACYIRNGEERRV